MGFTGCDLWPPVSSTSKMPSGSRVKVKFLYLLQLFQITLFDGSMDGHSLHGSKYICSKFERRWGFCINRKQPRLSLFIQDNRTLQRKETRIHCRGFLCIYNFRWYLTPRILSIDILSCINFSRYWAIFRPFSEKFPTQIFEEIKFKLFRGNFATK